MKSKWYKRTITQLALILCIVICSGSICYAADKEYEYDDNGRVTKVTYEDGSYETYEYDKNGNIIQVTYTDVNTESSEEKTDTQENTTSEESNSTQENSTTGESDATHDITIEESSSTQDKVEGDSSREDGNTKGDDNSQDGSISSNTGDSGHIVLVLVVMGIVMIGIYKIITLQRKEER